MEKYEEIINVIRDKTDEVILFHSATGKDSIVLLDMLAKRFNRVVCAFMYLVKDLEHQQYYINYACKKYHNVSFIKIPHFTLGNYIKYGHLGHWCNPKQKQFNIEDCLTLIREKTGIEWVCIGFKKSDGLNRRLMLMQYEMEGIYEKGHKFFPLASYTNKWCLKYIKENDLIPNLDYGIPKGASCEFVPGNLGCLLWLKENYPDDLAKVYRDFPMAERLVFEYERKVENYGEDRG